MNRILNPFEYLSTGKALGWGLAGTLFSICLLTAVSWPVGDDLSKIVTILSSNLLLWIPLSLLLYVLALLFSPSRIRAVDIFATNLFAMLPTIVILGGAERAFEMAGRACLRAPQRLRGDEARRV